MNEELNFPNRKDDNAVTWTVSREAKMNGKNFFDILLSKC